MVTKNPHIRVFAKCTAVPMSERNFIFIFYQFTDLIISSNNLKAIKIQSNFCFIPILSTTIV